MHVPVFRLQAPEAAQKCEFEFSSTKTKSPSPAVVGHFAALWSSRRIAKKLPPDAVLVHHVLDAGKWLVWVVVHVVLVEIEDKATRVHLQLGLPVEETMVALND